MDLSCIQAHGELQTAGRGGTMEWPVARGPALAQTPAQPGPETLFVVARSAATNPERSGRWPTEGLVSTQAISSPVPDIFEGNDPQCSVIADYLETESDPR